jgi:hypothetical protein
MKLVLCDTIHHPTPILLEWWYGLVDLGYDALYLPVPEHSILQIDEVVDVLIYAGAPDDEYYINQFYEFKNRQPACKIIVTTDNWKSGYIKYKQIVDFFIMTQHSNISLVNTFNDNGFQLYSVPLAANHRLFYKTLEKELYDATFIGNLSHGYRGEDKFLYPILDNQKYSCFLGGMIYGKYNHGYIPYNEHNSIRNQTKINLNFHVPYQKPNRGEQVDRIDLNQSVYNIALSGNFQLCDHPLVESMFNGNIPIGTEDNWLDLFNYFLENPDIRHEKAHNAKLIAEKEHTWLVRMKEFLEILETHYLK